MVALHCHCIYMIFSTTHIPYMTRILMTAYKLGNDIYHITSYHHSMILGGFCWIWIRLMERSRRLIQALIFGMFLGKVNTVSERIPCLYIQWNGPSLHCPAAVLRLTCIFYSPMFRFTALTAHLTLLAYISSRLHDRLLETKHATGKSNIVRPRVLALPKQSG
jgi:hypothetical protein